MHHHQKCITEFIKETVKLQTYLNKLFYALVAMLPKERLERLHSLWCKQTISICIVIVVDVRIIVYIIIVIIIIVDGKCIQREKGTCAGR